MDKLKKIKLPPQHVFQKEDDDNCGPSCLAMIYRFKGRDYKVSKVLKDLNLEKNGEPTYPAQLARHLNKNNIKTKLTFSNSNIISPAWATWDNKQIIEALKDWVVLQPNHEWHKFALQTLFYLQEGGIIELKSYTVEDFKRMLDRGSLIILCIDEVWIWGHRMRTHKAETDEIRGKSHGHFVVVTKYHQNTFTVLDPYPTNIESRHGSYTVEGHQLLNSSLIWASTILEILS